MDLTRPPRGVRLLQGRENYFQSRSHHRNLRIPKPPGRHSPSFYRGDRRPRLLVAASRCPHECRRDIVVVPCLWRRSLRRMTPTFAQRFVEDLNLRPSPGRWLQTQRGFFVSCSSFTGWSRPHPTEPAVFQEGGRSPYCDYVWGDMSARDDTRILPVSEIQGSQRTSVRNYSLGKYGSAEAFP